MPSNELLCPAPDVAGRARANRIAGGRAERWCISVLLLALLGVYLASRVVFVSDSSMSLWLAERIVYEHSLTLDPLVPGDRLPARSDLPRPSWQMVAHEGHWYYGYPLLPVVLATPFTLVANAVGWHAHRAHDAGLDVARERQMQHVVAALLMTALCGFAYAMARLRLPPAPSVAITLLTGLGTSAYSTMSTALWSQTWAALLLCALLWHVLRAWRGQTRLRASVVGILGFAVLACRPAAITGLLGVAVLALLVDWRSATRAALWFALCAALAALISWLLFGRIAPPSVYGAVQFNGEQPLVRVFGSLLSPGRGLLIYSPWIAVALCVWWRGARSGRESWAGRCALLAIGAHLLLLSVFIQWWGSWSYGPRLMAELTPWFAVLGIEAWAAWRARPPASVSTRRTVCFALAISGFASIAIHAQGVYSERARCWTGEMRLDDAGGHDAWNWRYPQFLAAWLGDPHVPTAALQAGFPRPALKPGDRVRFDRWDHEYLFADGWSNRHSAYRGVPGADAQLVLRVAGAAAVCLAIDVAAPRTAQALQVFADDREIGKTELRAGERSWLRVPLTPGAADANIVLRLHRRDAPPLACMDDPGLGPDDIALYGFVIKSAAHCTPL